ncbi:hypothetical protein CDL12_05011 [Handroanthus impetiginosus]|uniref:Nucleosome assembly protein (NAP) n=1 Tax=Handroanthus impetiginosus TaxID=429701 RepID=A0A2G9HY76_9LAMI|nr:hypothetical protein CDL12_05011 [Handroanthus impetiginosus]
MSNPNKDSFDMSGLDTSLPAAAAALSAEDRAGLVNALKSKLQNLAGQHVDVMETLSPKVRKRVEALRTIQAEELQNLMEQDYDIGSTIRDKIIPHAVSWFTGEAVQGDELDMADDDDNEDTDEDDDEEEEDEDEEEEDDEDDEDEEEVKNKKKKNTRVKAGEGEQGERPAECKQQ